MNLLCSECYGKLRNPYVAIISAYMKDSLVQEGPGLGVCAAHLAAPLPQIQERYQGQQGQGLTEGLLYLVDFAESKSRLDGTIEAAGSHPAQRSCRLPSRPGNETAPSSDAGTHHC